MRHKDILLASGGMTWLPLPREGGAGARSIFGVTHKSMNSGARNIILALSLCFGMLLTAPAAYAEVKVETTGVGHGVKAWYVSNQTAPVVDIILTFEGAGNASDPEGKGGRAAFAAAMLTEGAGALDSAAFRRALDENAITLEVEADEDRLKIHIYCLREHAPRAGELLAMAIAKPLLAPNDQTRMKSDIRSIMLRLDERPSYQAARMLNERVFQGHPYANPPYGTQASLAALTAQDVRDYLKTYITRGNVLIAASGDVDSGLLGKVLEPVVDALAGNDSGAVSVAQTTMQGGGETLRKAMAVPQTTVLFAGPAIARSDPRFYAQYLLNHILGGSSLFSRLGDEVRQKKGLAYSIDTDLDMKRGTALISGQLATRNATTDEAIAEVKSVLADLHDKGATTQECDDAKSYVIGSFSRKLDSSGSVSSLLLAMQIHKLGTDYIRERERLFSRVSCAQINEVAAEILAPSHFVFSVVGGSSDVGGAGPIPVAPVAHNDVK